MHREHSSSPELEERLLCDVARGEQSLMQRRLWRTENKLAELTPPWTTDGEPGEHHVSVYGLKTGYGRMALKAGQVQSTGLALMSDRTPVWLLLMRNLRM